MKKRWLMVLVVIVAMSLVMGACGGGIETPAKPPPGSSPAAPPETTAPAPAEPLEVIELTLMNHEGPQSPTAKMLDAWCAKVLEVSGGALKITAFHGSMGGPRDTYNMVVDGSVDIGFGLPTFYPGVFPATEVVGLPFIGARNAMQAGHAAQDLYLNTPEIQAEWKDVHVIMQSTNTVSPLITAHKKVEKVSDLKGMNIRTVGAPVTEWAKIVGANPMPVDLGEVYTAFEKGVINAITSVGWEAVEATAVWELGQYFLDFEMQVNPMFIVMNQDSWNNLPDTHKAFIEQCSFHDAIDIMGDERDQARQRMYDAVVGKGAEIYRLDDLDPAEHQNFLDAGDQARTVWRDQVAPTGADALGLEKAATELMKKYEPLFPFEFR